MSKDNAHGQIGILDRDGRRRDFRYDPADQLISEIWSGANAQVGNIRQFAYDRDGNLVSARDNNYTYTLQYDDLNRLTHIAEPFGFALSYGYDAADNRIQAADNAGGTQTSTYDAVHNLTSRAFSAAGTSFHIELGYDANNRLTSADRYDGLTLVGHTDYGYDPVGRTNHIQHSLPSNGSTIALYDYHFDLAGRLTSETDNTVTTTYSYDATDQLTAAGANGYSYDSTGNRAGGSLQTGPANQLLSDNTWDYHYDQEGNLVEKDGHSNGLVWQYTYDNENHLLSATETFYLSPFLGAGSGTVITEVDYSYDPFGRRIERVAHTLQTDQEEYAYDGSNVWADLDANDQVKACRQYLDAVDSVFARLNVGGLDPAGPLAWYLTDRLGTVRDIAMVSGLAMDHLQFDEFGNLQGETQPLEGDRYGFTGRERDALTGLQYNDERWYAPDTARWLSEDPIRFQAGDVNLYRYVGNDATGATDPSGLTRLDFVDIPDGREVVNFIRTRFFMDKDPVMMGYLMQNEDGAKFVERNGRFVPLDVLQSEVDSFYPTHNWEEWFAEHSFDPLPSNIQDYQPKDKDGFSLGSGLLSAGSGMPNHRCGAYALDDLKLLGVTVLGTAYEVGTTFGAAPESIILKAVASKGLGWIRKGGKLIIGKLKGGQVLPLDAKQDAKIIRGLVDDIKAAKNGNAVGNCPAPGKPPKTPSGGINRLTQSQGGYIDPRTNKWVEKSVGDYTQIHSAHIYPSSRIKDLPGFEKLTRAQQDWLLNHPDNFIPLPKQWNSSMVNQLADQWAKTPRGSKASKEFIDQLRKGQEAFERMANEQIAIWLGK